MSSKCTIYGFSCLRRVHGQKSTHFTLIHMLQERPYGSILSSADTWARRHLPCSCLRYSCPSITTTDSPDCLSLRSSSRHSSPLSCSPVFSTLRTYIPQLQFHSFMQYQCGEISKSAYLRYDHLVRTKITVHNTKCGAHSGSPQLLHPVFLRYCILYVHTLASCMYMQLTRCCILYVHVHAINKILHTVYLSLWSTYLLYASNMPLMLHMYN